MNNYLTSLLFIITSLIAMSQKKCQICDSISVEYINAKFGKNDEAAKIFFDLFPNSFEKFTKVYSYDSLYQSNNYDSSLNQINYFLSLEIVSKREKYTKIIEIGINGKWEADAVNYLLNGIEEILSSNSEDDFYLFCEILSQMKKKDVYKFWCFYFSRPYKKEFEKNLVKIEFIYPEVYKSSINAFNKSISKE